MVQDTYKLWRLPLIYCSLSSTNTAYVQMLLSSSSSRRSETLSTYFLHLQPTPTKTSASFMAQCSLILYTGCLQMNGAVSKVNKKFISHLTRAQPTPSAAATVRVSHALPGVRSLVLTTGLRGQFPRWRRRRKRLSVWSMCAPCMVRLF